MRPTFAGWSVAVYLTGLTLAALVSFAASLVAWDGLGPGAALVPLAFFSVLARLPPPISVRHVSVNMHSVALITSTALLSPAGAMLIHAVPAAWRYRAWPSRALFNAAGPCTGILLASLLVDAIWGERRWPATAGELALEIAVLAAALGAWNAATLVGVRRVAEGTPVATIFRELAARIAIGYIGYAVAAYLVVLLWAVVGLGWFSVVLVLPSLALAQWALLQYHREDEAYEVLLTGLVEAMDERLPGSRERSRLCADTARVIAETLRVEPRQAQTIVSVARLHDVGLLAVDHEAPGCRADGRCTADSQAATSLRRHVDASAELLSGVTFLSDALPGIRAHHERYDGTGYPDGLSGSAIPLAARVVAVADAWASLVHPLDGSTPLAPEDAVAQCREWSGSALDPACVAALEAGLTRQPGAFTPGVRGMTSSDPFGSASLVDHAHPDCTQTLAHLTMPGARA